MKQNITRPGPVTAVPAPVVTMAPAPTPHVVENQPYGYGPAPGSALTPGAPAPGASITPYQPPAPRNTRGNTGGTTIGGVSAVNPQAGQMDYGVLNPFIKSAWDSSMTRLQPQIDQSRDRFDQQMINRGIPVGSDAYNEAKQSMEADIGDALTRANFGAMQFGTGIQDQMFGQNATRSQLANALLRSKWGMDLGHAQLGEGARQFDAGLGERARQFDNQQANLMSRWGSQFGEGQRRFDASFGEGQRQFNDMSQRSWDAQSFGQMMGLENLFHRDRMYQDSRGDYDTALLMSLLGMQAPFSPYYADPMGAYSAQLGYTGQGYGNLMKFLGTIASGDY